MDRGGTGSPVGEQHESIPDALEALIDSAIERERNAWQRRLHDGPVQDVQAARLRLDALSVDRADARAVLAEVVEQLGRTVAAMRDLLDPPDEDPQPLRVALAGVVAGFEGAIDELNVRIRGDDASVDANHSGVIVGVVNEALTNVVKHADASAVSIDVVIDEPDVTVTIADDGVGPSATPCGHGSGLDLWRRCASQVGGRLHFGADGARGSALVLELGRV